MEKTIHDLNVRLTMAENKIAWLETDMAQLKEDRDLMATRLGDVREKLNEVVDMPMDPKFAEGLENIMNYSLEQAKGKK